MEADDPIPEFDSLKKALDSGGPFRLTTNVKYSLGEVPEDKRGFFHNALLMLDQITWTITNEEDIQFLTKVIKEHQRIDMLDLTIGTDIDITQLAAVIESSNIGGIELKRDCESDISPILTALRKVVYLKKLILWHALDPQEYEALACAIQNEQLEKVSIWMSNFPPEVWTSLTPVISAHTTLKTLLLPWSYGGAMGLKAIAEVISKNTSIQKLSFDDDFYTTTSIDDTKMLCDALKSNSTLTSVSTSCFEAEETKLLFEMLAYNQVKLSTFKLNQARINNENLRILNDSLSTNTTLTSLTFTSCTFSDDTCQTLCRILASNKTIERLDLFWNEYDAGGIKAICELVNSNDRLKVLNLSRSTTTTAFDEHCKEIAQMLRSNTSLTVLDLSTNKFSDQGVNDICEAMVHNTTVKKLRLSSHYQDTYLASNLTSMLARNKTLRHLQVMVDTDVKESRDLLCEGLAQNDSLTHLDISLKPTEKSDGPQLLLQSLVDVLKDNYALTTVSIISRGFNVRQIERLLQRNRQLKSDLRFKVAILSYNIALSSHALTIFPREIWKKILSSITSSGMEPFDGLETTKLWKFRFGDFLRPRAGAFN